MDDLPEGDVGKWAYWTGEDKIAAKEEERWVRAAKRVVTRYRDERAQTSNRVHNFNILWSNVQTLIPALYARTPKPDVQRRFGDPDSVGRYASMLMERALTYSLENVNLDPIMEAVVQDRLLPGRGTARVMYIPHYGDVLTEPLPGEFEASSDAASVVDNPGDAKKKDPLREVVYEEAVVTYVYWEDYREGPARTWAEVPWVRYQAYMTREQLVKRFGATKGKKVNLDFSPKGMDRASGENAPPDMFQKAVIREYWDRTNARVIWLAPGTPNLILDEVDDPLGLKEFFPSPDPLLATTTTDRRIPVPDYDEYRDQADELDKLTARIDILTDALKVSGVYPGEEKATLQQLIGPGTENKLIPVLDWAAWMDKGGLKSFIQWMPIREIAETLIQLYAARDKTKEMIYEITGIGDIMRGSTSPNETFGAQQLKANFSTRRIQPQQKAVARFARDLIQLLGGVIAGHFSAQTFSAITGYPKLQPVPELAPPPPQWLPAPMMAQQFVQSPVEQMAPEPPPPPPPPQLPPEAAAQLREGTVTTFRNGSRWTLEQGQPRMVA
jgi:hypothetical protein